MCVYACVHIYAKIIHNKMYLHEQYIQSVLSILNPFNFIHYFIDSISIHHIGYIYNPKVI